MENELARNPMKRKILNFSILAVICLALLVAGVWFFLLFLRTGPEIQAALLTVLASVAIAGWAHHSGKKREIAARHFSEKRQAYMKLVDTIFGAVMAGKPGQARRSQQKIASDLLNFKKHLMVWAGADFIRCWNEFETDLDKLTKEETKGSVSPLLLWDRLLRELRKDLGQDDAILEDGELAALLLVAEEKKHVAA